MKIRANFQNIKVQYYEMVKVFQDKVFKYEFFKLVNLTYSKSFGLEFCFNIIIYKPLVNKLAPIFLVLKVHR
jgi:hypothetical protein